MFIKELHILTDNPEESSAFYANGLGLPVLHETDNSVTLSLKHSTLTFHHSEVKNPKYHFAINIPRNKINEALNWVSHIIHPVIIENGSAVADFRNWHAEAFYFFDNNGNILELIARRDLKNEA